ncbi:DUF6538 domain-containing protein [Cupriavidus necator]
METLWIKAFFMAMSRLGVTQAGDSEAMCTHLSKRGSRYYVRRRIPTDLVEHFGRKELWRALGTSDRREAERLCRAAGAALDAEFEQARTKVAAAPFGGGDSQPSSPVSQIDVDAVASRTLAAIRRRRDEALAHGYEAITDFMERQEFSLTAQEAILRGELEPHHPSSIHEAHRNALRAFLTGDGSVRSVAPPPAQAAAAVRPKGAGTTLPQLVDKWAAERKPDTRTIGIQNRVVRRFHELVGAPPVEQIERKHVVQFKDKLLESGQTATNTNKYLTNLSTLLNYAASNLLLPANPASGVKVLEQKRAKEARLPFDLAALNAIFAGPVHAQRERPRGGAGEAAYWLPLLGLFTGARLEELAQLRPEDVYQEAYIDRNGVEHPAWVIAITDRGDEQGLKNASSRRRVPVHAVLQRLGFIEYAQQAKGRHRIFHELRPDSMGAESGNWSKWFGKYLRKVKVTDKRMVFHSFRHKFKDAARDAGIAEDVSDALSGHSNGSVARNYGSTSYPLRPLVEAMAQYRIPGLVLPALP